MRRLALVLALTLPFAVATHAEKPRKPKPALPAAQYPFFDSHPNDKITVAAEPCDTKETLPDTRLDYSHHGFLVVRIIVTNDSDKAVSLDDARIHFIAQGNVIVQAATDDELQRRMFSKKSAAGTTIPMPAPIPSITIHHKPVDKQIIADDADFGFTSTTVAPHTTASGYLYYDTRDIDEPILEHASIELREMRVSASNKELESFEIPLKPSPEPAKSTASKPAP
jgi:hypothetical protein